MADNPNVGPDPVEAIPNQVREKTYRDPTPPTGYKDALKDLPETTAQDKVREDMSVAADKVKRQP